MEDSENNPQDNSANREPVFYYSRERRLSRASPGVQALNDGKPIRASIRKTLLATRSHRLIFFSLIFACVSLVLASRFTARESAAKLGGNAIVLRIAREEGVLILDIAKTSPKSGEVYIGAVDLAVSPVLSKQEEAESPSLFAHRIYFNPVESETQRVSLPFDGDDFFVILKTENEQKSYRIKTGK